ncbi:MAG: hypothetical protein JW822_00655 [Spirochaetales bacterium]|nr:hypothetical protein [Spirochaetales bacterium]
MEFLSDLNEFIEVPIPDQEIEKNDQALNILVDNRTEPDNTTTKPHFNLSRQHFKNLLSDLDAVTAQLDRIKQAAESYAKQKNSAHIQTVKKALNKIQTIFEYNIYRTGMSGSYWSNPLYDFRVWAGENMDQGERMPLGYMDTKSDGPDKIFVIFQQLQEMDITKTKDTWESVYEDFYALITFEKVRINSYLRRIDSFEKFNTILDQGASYYALKSKIFDIPTMTMQETMLSTAVRYMSLSIELLEEIKSAAKENLKALPDKKAAEALAFHTEQLIDEVNRLASHGHFNGMSLLTGRFSRNHEQATSSMYILLGAEMSESTRVYIPTLTAVSLVVPGNMAQPWKWDVYEAFTSEQKTNQFIAALDTSIGKIKQSMQNLDQLAKKLPEHDPYSKLSFDSMYQESMQYFLKSYSLTIKNLAYTAQPEHSINTQSTLVLLTLRNAHELITEKLINMRELAVQACNSVYNDQEHMKLNDEFAALIKSIEKITEQTVFNGEKILHTDSTLSSDRSIKLDLVCDEDGIIQKQLLLFPLDPKALELSRSNYFLEINRVDEANRAIGILDWALAKVNSNKARIGSCLQSVFIAEYKDSLMRDYIKLLTSAPKKNNSAATYLEYLGNLVDFTKHVYKKAEEYAWMAMSGVYTYNDREQMAFYFSNLLHDVQTLIKHAQTLSEALPQDITFNNQQKTKLSALVKYLAKIGAETSNFMEEIKNSDFLRSIGSARNVFEKITWIISIKE